MLRNPPAEVAAEAARYQLGRREAAYATRQRVSMRAVWTGAGIATAVAVLFAIGHVLVLALFLVPATLLGIAAYVYLLPPKGGRRWVVLHEDGFVEVLPGQWARAARWDGVAAVAPVSPPDGSVLLRLAGEDADSIRIRLVGLTGNEVLDRSGELEARINGYVQPLVLARAEASLRDGERVGFGDLAVGPDGLHREADGAVLAWDRVAGCDLIGSDRLRVAAADQLDEWFEGPVPNALAARALVRQGNPAGATLDGPASLRAELADLAGQARQRRRQAWRPVAALAALALVPAVLYPVFPGPASAPANKSPGSPTTFGAAPTSTLASPSAIPAPTLPPGLDARDVSGYSSVCSGRSYSGAAAYTGTGPHPIAFFGVGNNSGWNSGFMPTDTNDVLNRWYAKDVTQVQLVGCVDVADGPVVRSCGDYTGRQTVTVTLVSGDYTVALIETKTGKAVAAPVRIRGEQATECPVIARIPPGVQRYNVRTELSGPQVQRALARYVD